MFWPVTVVSVDPEGFVRSAWGGGNCVACDPVLSIVLALRIQIEGKTGMWQYRPRVVVMVCSDFELVIATTRAVHT